MNYATRNLSPKRNFAGDYLRRTKWEIGNVLRNYDPVFFSEGSEVFRRVGAGVFSGKAGATKLLVDEMLMTK